MTIIQLQYFQAVCDTGNIKTASAQLHVSQPAVSNSIRNLEQELHLTLLTRTPKGTVPTEDGLNFLHSVKDLLFHFEQLYQIAADISASHQKLRCGISPMVGSCIFPHIYNEYHKHYPEIQVEMITEKGIYSLYDMLQKDQLDVLLVPGLDIPETFASCVIREERLLFCISQKYMSGCQDMITAVELSKIPLVIMPPGHLQHKLVMNFFQSNHLEPNVLLYTHQLNVIRNFITAGTAGGFLYDSYVADGLPSDLMTFDIHMPRIPFTLVWKKEGYLFSSAKDFIHTVKSYS